jgi:hypothetical protein
MIINIYMLIKSVIKAVSRRLIIVILRLIINKVVLVNGLLLTDYMFFRNKGINWV